MSSSNVLFLAVLRRNLPNMFQYDVFYKNNMHVDEMVICNTLLEIKIEPYKFYSFERNTDKWMLYGNDRLLYLMIAVIEYPTRCMNNCIKEMFSYKHMHSKQSLIKISMKYDNPATFDELSKVTFKIEEVKLIMHENIEIALQNCVKLEYVQEQSQNLMHQAKQFKDSSKELNWKMWWKNIKMKAMITLIIIVILTVIISIISVELSKK